MNAKHAKIGIEIAALIALAILTGLFLTELRRLVRDIRLDVNQTAGELHATLITVNQAAEQARQASAQANLAAAEQRAYWNKTSLETYKTMAALRLTIVRTDQSINDDIAPKLAAALTDTDTLANTAAQQIVSATAQLRPTLANLAEASSAAAKAMGDPAIRETLAHVDQTSLSLSDTARNVDQMTASAARSADMVEERVRQVTKPASFAVRLGEKLLGLTTSAAQIVFGFFK